MMIDFEQMRHLVQFELTVSQPGHPEVLLELEPPARGTNERPSVIPPALQQAISKAVYAAHTRRVLFTRDIVEGAQGARRRGSRRRQPCECRFTHNWSPHEPFDTDLL